MISSHQATSKFLYACYDFANVVRVSVGRFLEIDNILSSLLCILFFSSLHLFGLIILASGPEPLVSKLTNFSLRLHYNRVLELEETNTTFYVTV